MTPDTHKTVSSLISALAFTGAILSSPLLQAAPPNTLITWGTPTTISSDLDVVTSGTSLYAYNIGTSAVTATTVNGVTFSAFAFPSDYNTNTKTVDSVTISENPGLLISYSNLSSNGSPYSNLSTNYKTLLSSAGSSNNPVAMTLNLGGLTTNQQYLFQFWLSNSSQASPGAGGVGLNNVQLSSGTGTVTTVTLDGNITDTVGGVGQYVTGTFTASSTSQFVTLTGVGNNDPYVNALQVRAVPEPSTFALLGLAGVLACTMRKRFRRVSRISLAAA